LNSPWYAPLFASGGRTKILRHLTHLFPDKPLVLADFRRNHPHDVITGLDPVIQSQECQTVICRSGAIARIVHEDKRWPQATHNAKIAA